MSVEDPGSRERVNSLRGSRRAPACAHANGSRGTVLGGPRGHLLSRQGTCGRRPQPGGRGDAGREQRRAGGAGRPWSWATRPAGDREEAPGRSLPCAARRLPRGTSQQARAEGGCRRHVHFTAGEQRHVPRPRSPAEKRQSQDWNPRRTDDVNRGSRGGGFRGKRAEGRPRAGDSEATGKLTRGDRRPRLGSEAPAGGLGGGQSRTRPPCRAWGLGVPGIHAR